jgi:hypothetical protein
MNLSTFERAQLAGFAYKAARRTGSLDCMKAICYVLRNRLRAGWGNGTWLSIMDAHPDVEGNSQEWNEVSLDAQDRLLQLLVRDIDDIYMGTSEDDTKGVVQDALYFQFIDQQPSAWFVEHIVRDAVNHPRIAQVGPLAFFK